MRYSFANMLRGRSDVSITDRLFRFDDPTPFHDELRMVTPNLVVGRWVTGWSSEDVLKPYLDDFKRILPIELSHEAESFFQKMSRIFPIKGLVLPEELGVSFLGVERNEKMKRGLDFHISSRK
jgi:hypothetical protein